MAGCGSLCGQRGRISASFSSEPFELKPFSLFLKAYFSCHCAPSFNACRMPIKCISVCERERERDHKRTLLNNSGFYDNTENVKMKMTRSRTDRNDRRRTRGVAGIRGVHTVTHTDCSATLPSGARDEDRPIRAGWRYNHLSASLKAPRRIFGTITTFKKWSQFSSVRAQLFPQRMKSCKRRSANSKKAELETWPLSSCVVTLT